MKSHTEFRAHEVSRQNPRAPLASLAVLLALFAVLSLSGCTGLTGAGTPPTTSKSNTAASVGTLTANATSFSFGNVAVGSSTSQMLMLTNTGTATVNISQASVTGTGFSVAGGMSSVSIPAGQNQTFQIQFAPKSTGTAAGSIAMTSDASNSPLAISLSGNGMTDVAIATQPANQSVVAGQTATFSVMASGSGTLTYQWLKNGSMIGGATAASYTTPATASSDNGAQFTVVVTDTTGSVTSGAAILTVTAAPVAPSITAQPASRTVTLGQTASFSVTATGTAPLTYQWKRNGTAIGGATAATYTTPATTATDNGAQFTVTVTNATGTVTSSAATLTVNVPPSITTQPASQTVTAGQTATFSVTASGSGTLTYQWSKNGATVSGATAATYTTPATAATDNGSLFAATVTNSTGNVTSGAATLTVNVPPSITTQPASQTVALGQTAAFSVVASGTGTLTYQWKKNGAAISGATAAAYTTPATAATDSGAQFTVTVTNAIGSGTSSAATLTVNVPPSITTQPAGQTVTAGQTATFSVAASGTGTLTYQWKKNGAAVSGATAATYTTPATAATDNGSLFTVTVTNSTGNVTSSAATLTVNVPPSITTQPANQSVIAGQTATFNVTASGSGTLSYQWYKNGSTIMGATAASYTTPATTASDNGALFIVTVIGSASTITSHAATLTVTAAPVAPSITTQPASQTVTAGQTATFSVTATGTATLAYQWSKNGAAISGATAASYTTPATAATDNGSLFTVTVTNSTGNVTSSAATLTVNVPPSITTQPANQSVIAGQPATFNVTASGSGTLSYQWYKNGSTIMGATAASYTTPATTASDNGALFIVTVIGSASTITSHAATLNVNVPPSITTQPANTTASAGQTASFSVAATGTATLAYQWKKNGTAISGATSASYTTPATSASDSGALFTVTVSNAFGSVTSSAATLTVNAPPSITTQPSNQTVTAGQTATFSVTASGSGTLSYQWSKNGSTISSATSASYTTPATTGADNGSLFTVTVSNSVGSFTSGAATLTVNVPPTVTSQPTSQTVIAGQAATFSVTATGTATLTYQWKKNGTAIGGATSASYTTPAETTADNGALFTVTVTNAAGNVTSNAATLTVNAATLILNASQTSLSFSSVNLGSSSILPVTFTNAGNSSVTISGVSIAGAGFTAAGVSSGQILTSGQTATLNVTFTPSATGSVTGSVTVTSNATNSPSTISLTGTGVQPVSHSVTLSWTASTSAVSGYNVYRSSVSGGPYTKLNSSLVTTTSYTDATVQAGQTYYYVVTSVDSSGNESAYSTEVSATVP
ncbi:MAG: immunoglobulin domain-containing protein [Candidatus Acidiferrales bacterium]